MALCQLRKAQRCTRRYCNWDIIAVVEMLLPYLSIIIFVHCWLLSYLLNELSLFLYTYAIEMLSLDFLIFFTGACLLVVVCQWLLCDLSSKHRLFLDSDSQNTVEPYTSDPYTIPSMCTVWMSIWIKPAAKCKCTVMLNPVDIQSSLVLLCLCLTRLLPSLPSSTPWGFL